MTTNSTTAEDPLAERTMAITVGGLAGDSLDLEDGGLLAAEQLHRRQISEEQLRKFEGYAAEPPILQRLASTRTNLHNVTIHPALRYFWQLGATRCGWLLHRIL